MAHGTPLPPEPDPARYPPVPPGADVVTADGVYLGRVVAVEGGHLVVAGGDVFPQPARLPAALITGSDGHVVHLAAPASALLPPTNAPMMADPAAETLELREERLVPHTTVRQAGEVRIHTVVEEVPGRLEVAGRHDEVVVEHVPVGREVTERAAPREEGDVLVVPVYEEQLVVTKRLVLREELHIHRHAAVVRRLVEDTLRRERVVIEDPDQTGWIHERYPTDDGTAARPQPADVRADEPPDDGSLAGLVKRMFQ